MALVRPLRASSPPSAPLRSLPSVLRSGSVRSVVGAGLLFGVLAGSASCSGCRDNGATVKEAGATAATDGSSFAAVPIEIVNAVKIEPSTAAPPADGPPTTFTKTGETKIDRARNERVDPAPRVRVARTQLAEFHRQYERARHSGSGDALRRNWRDYLSKEVPTALQAMVEMLHGADGSNVLGAYEARYGAALWAEQFTVPGGTAVLVVHGAPSTVPKIGRFDEHERYTVVRIDTHGDGGAAASATGAVDLDALFPGVLEMQDARIGDAGVLFVNAVHPGPASDVDGKTGYLYAIDLPAGKLVFQTAPGRSRGDIGVDGDVVFTTFSTKADQGDLFALDAKTGAKLASIALPAAANGLRVVDHRPHVGTPGADIDFALQR